MEPVQVETLDLVETLAESQRHAMDEEAAQVKGGPHYRYWEGSGHVRHYTIGLGG